MTEEKKRRFQWHSGATLTLLKDAQHRAAEPRTGIDSCLILPQYRHSEIQDNMAQYHFEYRILSGTVRTVV